MSGGDSDKKKRIATVVVSSFILVVIGTAVIVGIKNQESGGGGGGGSSSHVSASNKAVEAMCQPTDYKDACVESLQAAGSNVTDPKELIKVGFNFTKKKLAEIMEESATLKEAEKDPMASQALAICRDQMDLAIDHLEQSLEKIGVLDITKVDDVLSDLGTWLESVLVYQGTCLDEFENVTSPAIPKIKEALNSTIKFSSNALVMVTELNNIFKNLNIPGLNGHRRLLQEEEVLGHGEFPTWLDPVRRKLLARGATARPNLVIAQDGTGNFRTFAEAVKALPVKSNAPFVVYVKKGVYREQVTIPKNVWNITWIGDGATTTKITYNKNFVDGVKTMYTATFTLIGAGHTFKNIGFENSAGAIKHQAVAIVVDGDRSAFFNCRFDGYQDTLYAHSNRQYYRDCTITGTIDFIFGDSRALFQNCLILIRRPLDNQQCIVTASGKFERHTLTGMVLQNCTITGDRTYLPVKAQFRSYLGRPWKEYAKTVYIQSYIGDVIHPDGWLPWLGTFGLNTCYYAEFNNRGPGSDTSRRVKWRGVKKISPAQAIQYTGGVFLARDDWVIRTGFPYARGMINV